MKSVSDAAGARIVGDRDREASAALPLLRHWLHVEEPVIAIEGLSFRFGGSERFALRDVSMSVEPGEFVLITGPSGCGKSTLALAIGGYLFRQFDGEAQGRVMVGGMDVRQHPTYDVAEVVGLVQQNPEAQFCTLTVRDEIAFGLENRCMERDQIRERMEWALSIVGAQHLEHRLLATLSGGEKQKVAVAAMMAAKPQVLILDEPTSNLDPTATAEILAVLERIRTKAGMTVIVIEHKVDLLRRYEPRFVRMEAGRITHDARQADWEDLLPRHRQARAHEAGTACSTSPSHQGDAPLVNVEDLRAGYDDTPLLGPISLSIHPGEFVAVMGDNGSGKTTFLQCLLGLLKPASGRVLVLGHDTRRVPVSRLARQVGYVFQNPNHQLFADSVWEEAIFAPRNFAGGKENDLDGATVTRTEQLLDRIELGERRDDHPHRLSYGQKRRLNLLSLLSYDPQLFLLDEMLIGQDPANAEFLLDLLQERCAQGAGVLLVHHAPEVTRRYATRLLFFEEGRIVIDAPTSEGIRQLETLGRMVYVR